HHQTVDRERDDGRAREVGTRFRQLVVASNQPLTDHFQQREIVRRRRQQRSAHRLGARIAAENADDARLQIAAVVLLTEAALRGLYALLLVLHVTLRERAEQRLLGREVVEQTALADAGGLGHDIQDQARGADLGDNSFGGFQNPVARRSGHRMCFYHWGFSWDWTVRTYWNCTCVHVWSPL